MIEEVPSGGRVTVSELCRHLGMSRQNFYARRRQRARREVDGELVAEMVRAERQVQSRLGGRKLHHIFRETLRQKGVKLGRDRFFELLRHKDLLVPPDRAEYPCTTDSAHALPLFPNRLKERAVSQPNQVWVADLTYVRTGEGFLYLSLITDKFSRKIVGYHGGESLAAGGCLQALEAALSQLPRGARPLHHSDRGSQYCSHDYVGRVQQRGLELSMTETNHCAENALAERMNGILKSEYGLGREFKTKALARRAIAQAVELYNTRRPHTALGYRYPAQVHSLAA